MLEKNTLGMKAILDKIIENLKIKRWAIMKRTVWLSAPGVIFIAVFRVFEGVELFSWTMGFVCAIGFFVLLYTAIILNIIVVEWAIWVNAYFKNYYISDEESWSRAKKLFWPALALRFRIFLRYGIFPIILMILPIFYFFYLMSMFLSESSGSFSTFEITGERWALLGISLLLLPLAGWIYFYLFKIKLRYLWFIFLDRVGENDYSSAAVIREMNRLNKVSRSETFLKALMIKFGFDSVVNTIKASFGSWSFFLGGLSSTVDIATSVVATFGKEYVDQMGGFAKIVGNYMIYKYAREEDDAGGQKAS